MKQNFEFSLNHVLKHEGGWSDHPKDPGGATMKGVTLATYSDWLGRPASKDELRNISDEHLREIYKTRYWDAVRGDDLPSGVDYVVFDMAVNSGPGRAARMLQSAVGATPDGAIGPRTLAAAQAQNPETLIATFQRNRQHFIEALPTFATFGKGWTRRVNETGDIALKIAKSPAG
jgi:lysozyme family protein